MQKDLRLINVSKWNSGRHVTLQCSLQCFQMSFIKAPVDSSRVLKAASVLAGWGGDKSYGSESWPGAAVGGQRAFQQEWTTFPH